MNRAFSILFLCSSLAFAQTPQALESPSVHSQTTVVLVPALVSDSKGELIFSLNAGDFRVTDNGVEQHLTLDEDTGSEPLALVVAVESGRGGRAKLALYHNLGVEIETVVGSVPHRVAVVAFDSTPRVDLDFTSDIDAAGSALNDLEPGDQGAAILDALKFSVNLLRDQPPNYRRAILLISETLDHGSQAQLDDALRAISDTNTAVYSLGFSSAKADAAHYADRELPFHSGPDGIKLANAHPNPPHGCMGKDPDPDATKHKAVQAFDCLGQLAPPLALAKMAAMAAADGMQRNVPESVANLTGGEYFQFQNSRSLVRDLVAISNHVPNRYVLSFQPQSPQPGFHAVQLKLNGHPSLHITARTGYWAESAAPVNPHP